MIYMEQYSKAYVKAIATVANFNYLEQDVDNDSADIVVKSDDYDGIYINIQLKSTSNLEYIKNGFVNFPLPLKNYNDLREVFRFSPRILVCLIIPKEDNPIDWIVQTEESLALKKCAYWIDLKGYGETRNTTSVTVSIPISQKFTPEALKNIAKDFYTEVRGG